MALDQPALLELTEEPRRADSDELMSRLLHTMLQALIDAEATAHIGAAPHERTATRTTQRNGIREKLVATAGQCDGQSSEGACRVVLPLAVGPPPAHRRRAARSGDAGLGRGRVHRKVDDLVAALGLESGISKSEVRRTCADLDEEGAIWRTRPLDEQARHRPGRSPPPR